MGNGRIFQTTLHLFFKSKIITEKFFFLNPTKVSEWVKLVSHVQLFVNPWTAAYQAPTSIGFSKQ